MALAFAAVTACGSEDDGSTSSPATGGGGGAGGSTASGGAGGSGGPDASAGSAGTSATGGSSGAAGTGGLAGSAGSAGTGGATALGFPRLATMNIGNPKNYDDPAHQTALAKYDVAVLGMYYLWKKNGKTPAQAVSEIRAKNPSIILANYTILTECRSTADPANQYIWDKLSTEQGPNGKYDWWARTAAGAHVDWSGGAYGAWDTNLTLFVTPDANGDRLPQWAAKQFYPKLIESGGFDMWYFDNNFWRPRSNADWNGDGKDDDKNDAAVQKWYREGERAHYEQSAKTAPNVLRMVNADNDLSGDVHPEAASPFAEYKDVVHAAFLEHVMGESWSVETWAGWAKLMGWYREIFENLLPPKIVVLNVKGASTDYQLLRYALATTLLHDGYLSFDPGDYHSLPWFDEYDLAGTASTKWLGAPLEAPPATAWKDGVYRRRFQNGMAIVNPKGNGVKTVSVEAGYQRIAGKQAPGVNDGKAASSITLQDRDGILLVKP